MERGAALDLLRGRARRIGSDTIAPLLIFAFASLERLAKAAMPMTPQERQALRDLCTRVTELSVGDPLLAADVERVTSLFGELAALIVAA